jgi:hypothetical protein
VDLEQPACSAAATPHVVLLWAGVPAGGGTASFAMPFHLRYQRPTTGGARRGLTPLLSSIQDLCYRISTKRVVYIGCNALLR